MSPKRVHQFESREHPERVLKHQMPQLLNPNLLTTQQLAHEPSMASWSRVYMIPTLHAQTDSMEPRKQRRLHLALFAPWDLLKVPGPLSQQSSWVQLPKVSVRGPAEPLLRTPAPCQYFQQTQGAEVLTI